MRFGAVRFVAVRCSAARCGTVRYSVVRFGAVQYGAVRFVAARCGMVRCSAARCGMVQYGAVRFVAALFTYIGVSSTKSWAGSQGPGTPPLGYQAAWKGAEKMELYTRRNSLVFYSDVLFDIMERMLVMLGITFGLVSIVFT